MEAYSVVSSKMNQQSASALLARLNNTFFHCECSCRLMHSKPAPCQYLGGTLHVTSDPKGTSVRLWLPLREILAEIGPHEIGALPTKTAHAERRPQGESKHA